ncbi:vWA domain-containing protein [Roseibacillus ishigakijimensis]|uniref:VWA domain-containing protein n=1 Tax=Roseibacillus ishigakijimensis TaxID=454146 RepID=A0A934RR87_9BACT|nr:vWA domain-containing protein [Roseibacillus ishigakijimensis]MBK1835480.1 VWA domain-containing protein [Roseibacillus ishigakijimensis]
MKIISLPLAVCGTFLSFGTPLFCHEKPTKETASEKAEAEAPKIQLALLLDTSNSMDGLIQQAKTELWSIVNTFGNTRKDGQQAFVEVALYEYGNNSLSEESYWIREVLPFTRDLDRLSEELFALTTHGGEEYCGAVVRRAVQQLQWAETPGTYKAIFVAGNEPFNQGPIDPGSACREAMGAGVVVNSIHCGDEATGVSTGWKSGALVTGGSFSVIDQNKEVAAIECPQDKIIIELNGKLNETYIRFGSKGQEFKANQLRQDENAASSHEAQVNRAVTKATGNYWNRSWDLVDACQEAEFDWSTVKKEHLPEEMQGLSVAECKALVAEKTAERAAIQKRIQELNKERAAYLAVERKRLSGEEGQTLGAEVRRAVTAQARALGYRLGE